MNRERYRSLNQEYRERFGRKIYKVSLNAGMTCPNRDGTLGRRGCLFCSAGGSGEFAASGDSIRDQIEEGIRRVERKMPGRDPEKPSYIAYFQAYTNTYAPADCLRALYTEAIRDPRIAGLSIATRPDCLPEEVLDLLEEMNREKPVWVELGLQTIREDTARYIRRGYALPCFEEAVYRLKERGLSVVVHLIVGLPGEGKEDLLAAADYLNGLPADGVKLQLLHVLEGTDLAEEYLAGRIRVLSEEEYLDWILSAVARLRPDITIHRLTGDGPKKILLAPLWSGNKKQVMNAIRREMAVHDIWQGKDFPAGKEEKANGSKRNAE